MKNMELETMLKAKLEQVAINTIHELVDDSMLPEDFMGWRVAVGVWLMKPSGPGQWKYFDEEEEQDKRT